jgi:glutathione synthase/RimK-type ligase-like ATP-grasp enzyme
MIDVCFVSGSVYAIVDEETQYLIDSLKRKGKTSNIENWDNPNVDWNKYTLCINKTTANYMLHPNEYIEWAYQTEKVTKLWNSAELLKWNHHKSYLLELQKKGIPIPPTVMITTDSNQTLLEATPNEWDEIIIKPAITGGSFGLRRVNRKSPKAESHYAKVLRTGYIEKGPDGTPYDCPRCDVLAQKYVPEIEQHGEASLIYFGGTFSHAVLKKPREGDFRAHPMWGAGMRMYEPSEDEIELGYSTLEATPDTTHYARIDLIPGNNPVVIEEELIDPNLFFNFFPNTVDVFIKHIMNHLNR